jgi:hypothetical protein
MAGGGADGHADDIAPYAHEPAGEGPYPNFDLPMVRYEHSRSGKIIRLNSKKLGTSK